MIGPPELHALIDLLPPGFAMTDPLRHETLDGRARGRCIEATRIAVEMMRALGFQARALACDVVAANRAAKALMIEGVPSTAWPPAALSVGVRCEVPRPGANLQEPFRRKGFGGHLVMAGDDWFADLTVEQFHRPLQGIVVSAAMVGPLGESGCVSDLDAGGMISWVWRPEVRAYRTVPAWRQDVGREVVVRMVDQVRRRVPAARQS